jgi:hypothetical protein
VEGRRGIATFLIVERGALTDEVPVEQFETTRVLDEY